MDFIILAAILFYTLSMTGYFFYFFLQKDNLQKTGYYLFVAGFLFHCFSIFSDFKTLGVIPVLNLGQTLIFTGWTIAGVFLLFQKKYNLKILGIYAAPLVTVITAVGSCFPSEIVTVDTLFKNFWLILHIITIFIGESAFALACGVGILYLLQERAIKTKKHRFFLKRLPSLEMLDSAGYASIVSGFTFTSIGLAAGIIYAKLAWGRYWSWDPKEVWSVITWLIYAVLLHERLLAGWRGKKTAVMAIIGFFVMMFTFLGVNLLLPGHHGDFTRW